MPRLKRKAVVLNEVYSADEADVNPLDVVQSVGNVDTLSSDGRRIIRHTLTVDTPTEPPKADGSEDPHQDIAPLDEDNVIHVQIGPPTGRSRRNNYILSAEHDTPMNDWLAQKDRFLREFMRLEGLRGHALSCAKCSKTAGKIVRCHDCSGGALLCQACCISHHEHLPFHIIKVWDGECFVRTALSDLGLVIQLGHARGEACSAPRNAPADFMILHTNGWHRVQLRYCSCDMLHRAGDQLQQLLRYELYPATVGDPVTCATFRALEAYHALTLQGKITVYDYYITLNNMTDNTGMDITWDRLKQLLRMVRQWRHLKSLKRAGRAYQRGHDGDTKRGELALLCPACPRPGVNIPDDWRDAPLATRFIYTLVLAVDANFRLKRRTVSSAERDPALSDGLGYFVESKEYLQHVLSHANQDDISTCTGFAAIAQANSRLSHGYAATGVGMVVCARHGFIQPNSVGDLQKGERYCNMDYLVAATLKFRLVLTLLLISYDIVCQWALRFAERVKVLPPAVRVELPSGPGELRYAIPKYHLRAHKEEGHNKYSLHLLKGVGRVCGEQIERTWPKHSETAGSTREMGPGSRQDTLEDHFGYTNWRVFVSLGETLDRLCKEAERESKIQDSIFADFRKKVDPDNLRAWDAEVEAYEANLSLPDPYFRKVEGATEAETRLELATEDDRDQEDGDQSLHEVTPAAMIVELLQIEDQQRKFRLKYPNSARNSGTASQSAEKIKRRTALRRRLTAIRPVQAIYMPCVPAMLAGRAQASPETPVNGPSGVGSEGAPNHGIDDLPEHEKLFLPHALTPDQRAGCAARLASLEERMRDAQLHESLDRLRVHLHIKARLVTFKNRHVRAQGPNTRARGQINTNEQRIKFLADKYRAARSAKFALAGAGEWCTTWRELATTDVRTLLPEDDPVNAGVSSRTVGSIPMMSKGRLQTSWIWLSADRRVNLDAGEEVDGGVGADMQDAVRVEYLKARARATRYQEQRVLLAEEKRRVLKTLEYEVDVWRGRMEGQDRASVSGAEAEGFAAYAARQATVRQRLKQRFAAKWDSSTAPAPADPEEVADLADAIAAAESDSGDDGSDSELDQ